MPDEETVQPKKAKKRETVQPKKAKKRKKRKTKKAEPKERHYKSFREAWIGEEELKRYTMIEGVPRLGMPPEDVEKAKELIKKYNE